MASSARLDELLKKFEENPRRYFAPLANEHRKLGDLEQAISLCRTHLPQQQGHVSGHIVLAQALYEARELEEARQTFESALDLDPENLIALRHLGDIASEQGERGTARVWYERVLDADPRNEDIAQLLRDLEIAPALVASEMAPASASADESSSRDDSGSYARGSQASHETPRVLDAIPTVSAPSLSFAPAEPDEVSFASPDDSQTAHASTPPYGTSTVPSESSRSTFAAPLSAPSMSDPFAEEPTDEAGIDQRFASEAFSPTEIEDPYGALSTGVDYGDLEAVADPEPEEWFASPSPEATAPGLGDDDFSAIDIAGLAQMTHEGSATNEQAAAWTNTPSADVSLGELDLADDLVAANPGEGRFVPLDAAEALGAPSISLNGAFEDRPHDGDMLDHELVIEVGETSPEAASPPSDEDLGELMSTPAAIGDADLPDESSFDIIASSTAVTPVSSPAIAQAANDDFGFEAHEFVAPVDSIAVQEGFVPMDEVFNGAELIAPIAGYEVIEPERAEPSGGEPFEFVAQTAIEATAEAFGLSPDFTEADMEEDAAASGWDDPQEAVVAQTSSPRPNEFADVVASPSVDFSAMVVTPAPMLGHTPALGNPTVESAQPVFATETLAELYLQQGFRNEALAVYQQLLEQHPHDESLQQRVAHLQSGEDTTIGESESRETAPSRPPSDLAGQSVRTFFGTLAQRRPRQRVARHADLAPHSGFASHNDDARRVAVASLDDMFGGRSAGIADDAAAASLAAAFSGGGDDELVAAPAMTGRPARAADSELSLNQLFRGHDRLTPAAGNVTLDQFYAAPEDTLGSGDPSDDGDGAPGESQGDIQQFTDWLEGLKKK